MVHKYDVYVNDKNDKTMSVAHFPDYDSAVRFFNSLSCLCGSIEICEMDYENGKYLAHRILEKEKSE